jgi:cysteinyl-tRNA synthetase
MELAEKHTRLYFRDMDALKVTRPDISPRATQHIPEQLEIIEKLVESGHAYVAGGNVYFSVASWPEYGRLSGRQTEEGEEGHRVEVRADKRDPRDFALWKAAERGHILRWRSPWGYGFPGWHIECSAMSSKYLGEEFDIHGGGIENQFPHHECEIAQSRAAGMPFARVWLHNNLITVDGQKMSKSLGNFTTVQEALSRHAPEVVRFWILSTHYRSPANYVPEALDAAKAGLERLRNCIQSLTSLLTSAGPGPGAGDQALSTALDRGDAAFHSAMDDDFNTPVALAALFDLVREVNGCLAAPAPLSTPGLRRALDFFRSTAGSVLGVLEEEGAATSAMAADPFIDLLVELRSRLKQKKDFETGDWLRSRLQSLGIEVKDSKDGSTWSRR